MKKPQTIKKFTKHVQNLLKKKKKNPILQNLEDFNNSTNWEIQPSFEITDTFLSNLEITYDVEDITTWNCGTYQLNNAPHYIQHYKNELTFLTNPDHPNVLKVTDILSRHKRNDLKKRKYTVHLEFDKGHF